MSSRSRQRRVKKGAEAQPKRANQRTTQSRRRAPGATAWREAAMGLGCAMVAIFVLAMDASLLNVFDLAKAGYTHALAWLLLGVLIMVAASDGLQIARSPLFLGFYGLVGVEILTTATATNRYVALYGEVGRYLGLTTHLVLALLAVAIAVGME